LTGFDDDLEPDFRNITNENLELPLSLPTYAFLGLPQQQCYSTELTSSESLFDTTFMYGYETGSTGIGISNPRNSCSLAGTNSSFDSSILSHNLATPENTSFSSFYENTTPPTRRSPKRKRNLHSSPRPSSKYTGGTPSNNGRTKSLLCHTNSHPQNPTAHPSFSLEHRIALDYSKTSISSGLVKIYHDSRSFLLLSMPRCRKISIYDK
jgi:hypothetical protein